MFMPSVLLYISTFDTYSATPHLKLLMVKNRRTEGADGIDCESQRNSRVDGWGVSVLKRWEMSDREGGVLADFRIKRC